MSVFSKVNQAFVHDPDDTENDGSKSENLVHEAEQVQLEAETHDPEKDVLGYGDADIHGCWHRFMFHLRMAFGILDRNAYHMTHTMQEALMNSKVEGEKLSLATANSIEDFWKPRPILSVKVLKGPLLANIYLDKWYNGDVQSGEQVYFIAYDALLLGLPRLRQLRMASNSCTIPQDFQSQISKCYNAYTVGTEDTSAFGPKNSTAWTYTSPEVLSAGYHWGKMAVYGGGGYYVDLPRNETEARQLLNELFECLWVDRGTRAIFLHLTVYNPNVNLFCVISLVTEIPASGGIITSGDFRTVKLVRYVTTQDFVVMGFECLFLCFLIYYTAEEIIEIYRLRCQYFKGFWNLVDILVILLASVCAGFNIYRTYAVQKNLGNLLASPDVYPNFERLSYWEMQFDYAVGILVFLVWIKIFKYVSFNKTMNQLNLTLCSCAKDIAGFGVMFFIVFFAFAQLGYLAFGTQVTDFATFSTSLLTLFRIILGDFDFQALHEANSRLQEIRKKTKQKKAQLLEIQNVIDVVDTDGQDMTIDDFKSEMKDSAGGFTLEQVFKKADINSDLKLSPAERSALKKTLEHKKMEIIHDMVNYQEAQLGQSFEQVAKFFADKTASKEEVNQAFSRLIRLETCIRTVTERIRAMAEKLESVEEAKSKRPDRLVTILENIISVR
ncbi:unnamed protein product [Schistocephalus solidus]|uniref:PKD_channel domain-containing protein n=1 Tax=Schistocephalus solidus TaxID=70667 RepID=A0A183SMB0_SCHSO|nr:unnamed protein product [Schistocephalus solidus]